MGSSLELRTSVREFLLGHVTEKFRAFDEARRQHPAMTRAPWRPRLHVRYLTDIISNFMVSNRLSEHPYTSPRARAEFLKLNMANRRRLVQARLDRLVNEGALVFFIASVVHNNSMDYPQKFREKCYRPPVSLLESIAFAAR